jgi:hypothetical protein
MVRWSALTVMLGLALLGLARCGGDDDAKETPTAPASATPTATPGEAQEPTPGQTPTPVAGLVVAVYFARGEHIAAGGRLVTAPAVARGAMEALLAGPNALERGLGMGSEIPAGTRLLGINIADGLATVDLSREFESGGGSLSMTTRVAQVVYTLTQFETVDRVTIRLDGKDVDAIGGEGVPAKNLTRDDFRDNTPLILVESPAPGAGVRSPLRVSGTSNTFEAALSWEVRDSAGKVIREGFATATSGTGTWGTFAFEVDLTGLAPGGITLVVFESSAKDGSPTNVYEVPLTLTGP